MSATKVARTKKASPNVSNIYPEEVYRLLGFESEYKKFAPRFNLTEDAELWKFLVLPVTYAQMSEVYRKLGITLDLSHAGDLDKMNVTSQRTFDEEPYVVGFNRCVEADEETAKQSARCRNGKSLPDINIKERLLLGAMYYAPAQMYLDIDTITMCQGSRVDNSRVPVVCMASDDKTVAVAFIGQDDQNELYRARQVQFFQPLLYK